MRIAIKFVVLVASLLAFVIIVGIGLVAAGVEESGQRTAGLALALAALLAFGSALFLLFAPAAFSRPRAAGCSLLRPRWPSWRRLSRLPG
jgi:hypothetical protein